MHTRTKRKAYPSIILRLILSVVFVFVILGFIYSLSNIPKNFNLNFLTSQNSQQEDTEGPAWILTSSNLLETQDKHKIFVQIASTDEELAAGLSWKDKLKFYYVDKKIVTEGMLFDFKMPMIQRFWMKDMTFDLDMIWLDENYKIVHLEKNALANSYNIENSDASQFFSNNQNNLARYVLEINAGLVDKMNLKEGDVLKFQ